MAFAVQRDDIHVKVGENQGLALEIIGGDRRLESGSDLNCVVDRENVGAGRGGVVVGDLVSSGEVGNFSHPRVDVAIDADETSPSKSGAATERGISVEFYTNSCTQHSRPESSPLTSQNTAVTTIATSVLPSAQVRRLDSQRLGRGTGRREGRVGTDVALGQQGK